MLVLVLCTGFLWGAAVKIAIAEHYHVACVGHGFVHGESTTDGSFFARVEAGCGGGVARMQALHVRLARRQP